MWHRPIKNILQNLKLVSSPVSEEVFLNAPELQLHLQHLLVILLNLMQFTLVSYKVKHHVKSKWISINKHLIILGLQSMPTRKHGCQCTALILAECRLPDAQVLLAADVQLNDVVNRLHGLDPLFFDVPGLLFLNYLQPLLTYGSFFMLNLS